MTQKAETDTIDTESEREWFYCRVDPGFSEDIMKRFRKIYLEISNICNLKCNFCPGTKRKPRAISEEEMKNILPKLRDWTDYLYFHLMGEPLCHPNLQHFLEMAKEYGFRVILTTNGSLLKKKQDILLAAPALHKVNISLHAFEANDLAIPFSQYLEECFQFGKLAEGKKLVVYRLWNQGGADQKNEEILQTMARFFPKPWAEERRGIRIGNRIFLEFAEKFQWPDLSEEESRERIYCYGLRDQIGILSDGTVVPCCLDHEGDIPLGNIFRQEMEEIVNSPKALSICRGFQNGTASEELCRKCGYAQRFKK